MPRFKFILGLLVLLGLGVAETAEAKQCVRNKFGSGISVHVYWYKANDVEIHQKVNGNFHISSKEKPFHDKGGVTAGNHSCQSQHSNAVAVVVQEGGRLAQELIGGLTLAGIAVLGAVTCPETGGAGCAAAIAAAGGVVSTTFKSIPDKSLIFHAGVPSSKNYLDVFGVAGKPKFERSDHRF